VRRAITTFDAAEIKRQVPIETILHHYGSIQDREGRWRCLFPERHHNGDAHYSVTAKDGRASCWSQQCLGEKGADVFELVGRIENLTAFPDQKRRVCEIGGISNSHNGNGQRKIAATYDYVDEAGRVLFQTVRHTPKDFRQRRPDADGEWIWNLDGVRLVLYRLPEVLKAKTILVVEGEKDVDTAYQLGLPDGWAATCNPMGASKWRPEYSDMLTGKRVVILPDADEAGLKHAAQVARTSEGKAAMILTITLPHGKDLSEWVESGGTAEAFASVLDQAEPHPANAKKFSRRQTLPPNRTHDGKQADCIIRLTADIELFHDPDMEPYATIPLPGHLETWPLNAREFRLVLQYRYFNHYGSTPSDQAMKEALATLSGQARFRGGCYPVRVRTAEHDGAIYLDLANKQWECVKITAQGWEIITNPPVKFRRSYGQGALPAPVKGGSVDALRQFVNVGSEDDWALVKGFVLYAFRPRGPYPVLAVNGEQGSAKSTTTKVIREIVDPNKASLRTQPREEQDLIIAAHNGWMPCLDNLSHLDSWLSDALCRLATGGGLSKRQLYTDSSEVILDVQRPLVLNGIENFVVRGDLQSRALTISAPAIDDKDRKTEEEFWRDFYQALPGILGAFLSALSQAIAHADHVKLPTLPRMADFARFVTAAEPALSISSGGFLAAYQGNQRESNDTVLESSPVAALLQQFLQDQPCWEGTASELLTELNSKVDEDTRRQKAWPKAPNRLSGALKRLAPNLRATGVVVGWLNRGPKRRLVRLEKARREHQDNEHLDGSSGPSSIVMPMINKTNEMTIRDDYDDTWPNESAL